jgi:hypothetical protein
MIVGTATQGLNELLLSVRKPEGNICESPVTTNLLTALISLSCSFSVACSSDGHRFEVALSIYSHLFKYYRLQASIFRWKMDNRYGNYPGGTYTFYAITFLPIDLTSRKNFNEF